MKCDALFFGAHPDDVELTAGGTVARLTQLGYKTGIVDLTHGEAGTRGSGDLRDQEAENAGKVLGISVRINLHLPDTNIENTRENQLKIIKALRTFRPDVIFIPYWEDRHPDHGRASHLCREAAFYSGLRKIETAGDDGNPQDAFRPKRIVYCRARYEYAREHGFPFIVDISDTFHLKMKAVEAYASQFHNPSYQSDEPLTHISTPDFLQVIETKARHYGSLIDKKYGEPFLSREHFGIYDPVQFLHSVGQDLSKLGFS